MKELTPMQAAYWVGRHATTGLGGVAAHLYAEFDGPDPDLVRLQWALECVCAAHPMLRARVTPDGHQTITAPGTRPRLRVEDLRDTDADTRASALAAKRRTKSHQKLDLTRGQALEVELTRLPQGRARLHVDLDMIAGDPPSFRLLIEDLAAFYQQPPHDLPGAGASDDFLTVVERTRTDAGLRQRRERDRLWWRERLVALPASAHLPGQSPLAEPARCHSSGLSVRLEARTRTALFAAARRHHLTPSVLCLAVFAAVVGEAAHSRHFRLNVPLFHRPPGCAGLVGDFSRLVLLGVQLVPGESLLTLARRLSGELAAGITHADYPGVSVMRDLSRHHGTLQVSPIVFTSGLGIAGEELFSPRVRECFGALEWVISQGPQVMLDAQVVGLDGGLLVHWDVRLDVLPQALLERMFARYVALLRRIAEAPACLTDAWKSMPDSLPTDPGAARDASGDRSPGATRPLSSLQQAYLLGRGSQLPLGGVAMHDFREFHGDIDGAQLQARLRELVARHPALRTCIDERTRTCRVCEDVDLPLAQIDLRGLTRAAALEQVAQWRERLSHRMADPAHPLWGIRVLQLPEEEPDTAATFTSVVFTSFDALILDGAGISTVLAELFAPSGDNGDGQTAPMPLPIAPDPARRQADESYWRDRLADSPGAPSLPWKQPLAGIRRSRYQRLSVRIGGHPLQQLTRIGAPLGLFANSLLASLVLEVLSLWTRDGVLCVGMPVALPACAPLGNDSTFIVVCHDRRRGTLAERARLLQRDVLEGLAHLSAAGVQLNRLLLRRHADSLPLPVVLTNTLSWPQLPEQAPVRLHDGLTQTPQVALDVRLSHAGEDLVISYDHAREALEETVVADMLATLQHALAQVCQRHELALDLPGLVPCAPARLRKSEPALAGSGFLERIAGHLFDDVPRHDALRCGEWRIGYRQLGERVQRVMAALHAHGVQPGQVVAICLPRSPEHLMVTLACALLGAVWVPIDVSAPAARRRYLLANCRADLLVGEPDSTQLPVLTVAQLLDGPDVAPLPASALAGRSDSDAPAYYLYTSGTTGKPKCVVLANRATDHVIRQTLERWQVCRTDVLFSATPLHHDMSVFDVFGALCAGATLVLPEVHEEKDAIAWGRLVERHGVSLWCSVPAILEMLLACTQAPALRSLRLVAQGGDYLKPATLQTLRARIPGVRLFSLGGPTETTIWSIWHEIGEADLESVPYGTALPGNRYFVLDETGAHCPDGVVGRIHTAGVNVALGYLVDGALHQQDFLTITDPAGQPVRAFRTGDLGSYRRDGVLLFRGRVQGYVKVRGVRVSLPDIENELRACPGIRDVLVCDVADARTGELTLAALYTCPAGADCPAVRVRGHAARVLPASHVPSRFRQIGQLPLSANGKPDRQQARALWTEAGDTVSGAEQTPEIGPVTRAGRILELYRHAIGVPETTRLDADSEFLAFGLRPVHLKRVTELIEEEFGVRVALAELLRCRTASQVSRLLEPADA